MASMSLSTTSRALRDHHLTEHMDGCYDDLYDGPDTHETHEYDAGRFPMERAEQEWAPSLRETFPGTPFTMIGSDDEAVAGTRLDIDASGVQRRCTLIDGEPVLTLSQITALLREHPGTAVHVLSDLLHLLGAPVPAHLNVPGTRCQTCAGPLEPTGDATGSGITWIHTAPADHQPVLATDDPSGPIATVAGVTLYAYPYTDDGTTEVIIEADVPTQNPPPVHLRVN